MVCSMSQVREEPMIQLKVRTMIDLAAFSQDAD